MLGRRNRPQAGAYLREGATGSEVKNRRLESRRFGTSTTVRTVGADLTSCYTPCATRLGKSIDNPPAQLNFTEMTTQLAADLHAWSRSVLSAVGKKPMRLFFILPLGLAYGCAVHERRGASTRESPWMNEAREFESANVRTEVEGRFQEGDFRFKGWVKSATDSRVYFPGITDEQAVALRQASLAVGEVLYIGDMLPFLVDDMRAWERRTTALFDYMQRFNRALFERLVRESRIPNSTIHGSSDAPRSP
jgi:hypothetical protein